MRDDELTWYMQEIAMHGLGVEIQFENLIRHLEDPTTRQTRLVWSYLSAFLSHAAMISKFIAPIQPSGLKRQRMDALRSALNISSSSEVLPRQARDNIEHFDERIDNWVRNSEPNNMEIVLPDKTLAEKFMKDGIRIKRVITLKELAFFSENRDGSRFELELMPLFEEARKIGREAAKWLETSSPYNFIFPSEEHTKEN